MASSGFPSLPLELLVMVISHLPNRDNKSLRLTCKMFHAVVKLRLDRVFLSANPRDVEVFRAVADHDTFRHAIVEIIWDDAVIRETVMDGVGNVYNAYDSEDDEAKDNGGVPVRFWKACDPNFYSPKPHDEDNTLQPPVYAWWNHYQRWRRQQKRVIETGADAAALWYGLARFPSLRTITITPSAHGFDIGHPLYETPTIRSFPPGFNYPLPRGWPTTGDGGGELRMPPWADEDDGTEFHRNKWRGFRVVLGALAQQADHQRVVELNLDTHGLKTGLNCRLFDCPGPEYRKLVSLLRRPGFRRLDLSLSVRGQEYLGWYGFNSTLLKQALSETGPDLTRVSLTTDVDVRLAGGWSMLEDLGGHMAHHIPLLHTIFPVDRWPNLVHFGLVGFLVTRADLLSLLVALPPTLRFVELGKLGFLDKHGHWRGLLEDMRDGLGWRDRPAQERPQVCVDRFWRRGKEVSVDAEVAEFLYGDGKNPFE